MVILNRGFLFSTPIRQRIEEVPCLDGWYALPVRESRGRSRRVAGAGVQASG